MTVKYAENLRRNFFYLTIRIDRHQPSLYPVIIRYLPGLCLIGSQSFGNDFFAIVFPYYQLGSVHIAHALDQRWLRVDVIEVSAGGA